MYLLLSYIKGQLTYCSFLSSTKSSWVGSGSNSHLLESPLYIIKLSIAAISSERNKSHSAHPCKIKNLSSCRINPGSDKSAAHVKALSYSLVCAETPPPRIPSVISNDRQDPVGVGTAETSKDRYRTACEPSGMRRHSVRVSRIAKEYLCQ
jgi:hypothetical protein